jgi:membrane protein implicated in regulation of membrane protease activity
MPTTADALRRWLGLLFLALAFGLLVWGQTVLRERLNQNLKAFVIYWGSCFVFTFAAIITALLDVRATRRRAQEEQNQLLQRTLEEIERDSKKESEE